ncbi:hypothetical protein UA24_17460 [Marinomonas sp. BSi20414]|nr:hypothetical protein [Marinomonas sp. BSi20414]
MNNVNGRWLFTRHDVAVSIFITCVFHALFSSYVSVRSIRPQQTGFFAFCRFFLSHLISAKQDRNIGLISFFKPEVTL